MRLLWVLSFVQTGCLVALLFTAGNDPASPDRDTWSETVLERSAALPASDTVSDASRTEAIEPALLRRIVREELALQLDGPASAASSGGGGTSSPRHPTDPRQVDAIRDRIEYYQRAGNISGTEIDRLLGKIAKLDSANRKAMLSKLVRSMNEGEIDGRM